MKWESFKMHLRRLGSPTFWHGYFVTLSTGVTLRSCQGPWCHTVNELPEVRERLQGHLVRSELKEMCVVCVCVCVYVFLCLSVCVCVCVVWGCVCVCVCVCASVHHHACSEFAGDEQFPAVAVCRRFIPRDPTINSFYEYTKGNRERAQREKMYCCILLLPYHHALLI